MSVHQIIGVRRGKILAGFLVIASLAACAPGDAVKMTEKSAKAGPESNASKPNPAEIDVSAAKAPGKQSSAGAKIPITPPFDGPPLLAPEEIADGWISLFDGKTLFGWNKGSKANWEVRDGVITVSAGEPGLLCTSVQFADYELKVDFKFAEKTNSGVFLHTPLVPKDPTKDCYELNIAQPEVSPFPTGSFVKRQKSEATAEPDQWHSYLVRVVGDNILVVLDSKEALNYTDPHPLRRGYVGLQFNSGEVEFRNVKLRPLGLNSLFNGKDLTGWKQPESSKSKFSVTPEGWLHVENGKGYLETENSYQDFVLQLECISNAKHLNSGVFFRCIPGQEMNGYESQIQNGYKDGDRTKPMDCGTGGIFRRVNARMVVPNDMEWFRKTIVADGAHVSVWVDGYQVTDWTDERAPDENPRKGLRREAGTIQIQGHDPTTNLSFRNLQAVELMGRAE